MMISSVLSSSSLFVSPFPARKKTTTTMLAMLSPDGDDRPCRLLRGPPESLTYPSRYLGAAPTPMDLIVALEDYVSELKFLGIDSQLIYEAAVETPLQLSHVYTDNNFWIKREDLQPMVSKPWGFIQIFEFQTHNVDRVLAWH
ncbi:hypothetical protein Vadar_022620 [Vaccinium darrowii]|uniref:Uncharacterized protein n=1 Tax=Vaccinium darrowii TaxID=229202 RepID=A0ACB7YZN4_9ERIC|nr:hypothetical protein Vadar_022620 [Vaccinium darrowii]